MKYPLVRPKEPASDTDARVYADLDALVRLQFLAQGFSFLPQQPVHSLLAGQHASRLRGRGLNFEELRRYLPGDDVRTIDWHVTARARKPFVRVYTEERDRPLLLVVDQRMSMFFGSALMMKSVAAAEVAALAAWRALRVGDRVGAIVFDDAGSEEISPHRSRQQVMRILESLVRKNHRLRADGSISPNASMLNNALARAVRLATHDFLVCIIGDAAGADAETVKHVTTLSQHNDVVSVFIYDPVEGRLPDAGRLVAASGALQVEVNSSDKSIRSKFQADFERRTAALHQLSRSRQIPVLPISAAEEVPAQLRKLLGHRPMQRRS